MSTHDRLASIVTIAGVCIAVFACVAAWRFHDNTNIDVILKWLVTLVGILAVKAGATLALASRQPPPGPPSNG